jgi:hypothetical protein
VAVALIVALGAAVGSGLAENAAEPAAPPGPAARATGVAQADASGASPAELEGASALAADNSVIPPPRWLKGRTVPAQPPQREHGTDGLIGWFPFRELYAASNQEAAAKRGPASIRTGLIRRNGGQAGFVDAHAE